MSCLAILGRLHWIDQEALARFILWCQVRARVVEYGICFQPMCTAWPLGAGGERDRGWVAGAYKQQV